MNFGKGITIFIILFVSFILTLVFMTFKVDVPLVAEDYYQQELDYQNVIDGQKELNKIGSIGFTQNEKNISIQFPFNNTDIKGNITWVCLSNKNYDFQSEISTDEDGVMIINLPDSVAGAFRTKMKFDVNGKTYHDQQEITVK